MTHELFDVSSTSVGVSAELNTAHIGLEIGIHNDGLDCRMDA